VIEGVDAVAYFPDILKLLREKLELFQLEGGSRGGGRGGHPAYTTADPSLFLAWAVVRFGELHVAVTKALLLEDGVAVEVKATARSWKKRWTKKRRKDTWRSTENAECWSRSSPNSSASNPLFQLPQEGGGRGGRTFNPPLLNPPLLACFYKPTHPPSGADIASSYV
jgi:hypothetical protein